MQIYYCWKDHNLWYTYYVYFFIYHNIRRNYEDFFTPMYLYENMQFLSQVKLHRNEGPNPTWTRGCIRALSFEVTDRCVSARCSPTWLLARQMYLPASWASTRRICIKSPHSWIRPNDSTGIEWPATTGYSLLAARY